VTTGRQHRVLFEQRYAGTPSNDVWMFTEMSRDPSGKRLLVISNGYTYQIEVRSGHAMRTSLAGEAR
jgi:hypothetical protein